MFQLRKRLIDFIDKYSPLIELEKYLDKVMEDIHNREVGQENDSCCGSCHCGEERESEVYEYHTQQWNADEEEDEDSFEPCGCEDSQELCDLLDGAFEALAVADVEEELRSEIDKALKKRGR